MNIGDNLTHLLQLAIIGTVCVLLAVFAHLDVTALLYGFLGLSGILSSVHLTTVATTKAASAAATTSTSTPTTSYSPNG